MFLHCSDWWFPVKYSSKSKAQNLPAVNHNLSWKNRPTLMDTNFSKDPDGAKVLPYIHDTITVGKHEYHRLNTFMIIPPTHSVVENQ